MKHWELLGEYTKKKYPIHAPIWHGDQYELLCLKYRGPFSAKQIDKAYNGLWRYNAVLPFVDTKNCVSFDEGMTPIVKEHWHNQTIRLKLDYLFPTGSYKDRGASVLISKIKELGIREIIEDSSGNAGCAIAAYARRAGISCEIVISENTARNKQAKLAVYEPTITKIQGNRNEVAEGTQLKAITSAVYYASHVWSPFFFEGTKTFAYEIWEQTAGSFPDAVVFPTGNGTLLIGSYIGFCELYERGLISKIPQIIAVQAANCSPLSGENTGAFRPTVADGIAVTAPRRKHQILEIIKRTEGQLITVREEAIENTWAELCQRGYYVEKTSAVGVAGFPQMVDKGNVLIALTGHGLNIG